MTVKLLMDWPDSRDGKQYVAGNLLTTDAGTETGLVDAKMATTTLTGGTAYVAPAVQAQYLPVMASANLTEGIRFSQGGLSAVGAACVSLRDWNGYDDTGSHDMSSVIQAAVTQLETAGAGTLAIENGSFVSAYPIIVKGGLPTLNGGYQGGIDVVGSSMYGTKLTFTSSQGLVVDCGQAPTHGSNSALAMIGFEKMHIVGPGKAISGSVGIDCSPQGAYQSTPNAIGLSRVWLDGFENLARFDDTTNLWAMRCYFLNYVKALRLGYNHDTMSLMFNRFGDNQTVVGSQTETAIAWDFISQRFTGATTLSGAQNHKIAHNWFMRQDLVADIWDCSASNITFEHNQFESCRHYAQIGNASLTQAPTRIVFEQNTFMRTDGQDETQAKFKFMNDAAAGSLRLTKNTADATTGPKHGWVRCGTGSVVEFDDNTLPVSGAYVAEANHLVVGASGKKIVLGSGEKYNFNTTTGSKEVRQWNASGNDSAPFKTTWAYNATNLTIQERWGAKGASSDTISGTPFDMVMRTINGQRYALASGGVIPLQGAALPSLGSDGAQWRGVRFLVQGSAGVADTVYECRKNASDAYAWAAVS